MRIVIVIIALLHTTFSYSQSIFRDTIDSGWMFRQKDVGRWLPATVPGTVHTDLIANKVIEDPFFRNNEQKMQWIDKINWEYTTTFQADSRVLESNNQQIIFYGVDTWADIYLNDQKIASTNNMFRTWNIDIKGVLTEGENRLHMIFYSPITMGIKKLEEYGLALPADNDYSQYGGMGSVKVSVYMRKAPYHFGWDWGPRLVPSGIWRPIEVIGWSDIKIEDIFIKQPEVSVLQAKLDAEITLLADSEERYVAEVVNNGHILAKKEVYTQSGENSISIPFSIKNPKLWWSNGLGEPHLYDFKVIIKKGKTVVAERSIRSGIRSIRLVRDKDKSGETFYFELNGVPVFAKGTNSIPNDIFLPRITPQDYEKMVDDLYRANMNMVRVWGGGIYEDDYFYELCDKYGIMVWQDFMFACAIYPDNKEFMENVRYEVIDNIIRLRNHPSIVLWCGNNEIDVAWARWGWKRRYNEEEQKQISNAYVKLAHQLLPELVEQYTDGIDYWPSSPMSGAEVDAHELRPATSGDNHYWGVWFEMHRFEDYKENIGRFISEHGFQSFPELSSIQRYALPEDYNLESDVMKSHQRSYIGNMRIKEYMELYYNVPDNFEDFIYMSQVLQARAMKAALQTHRRNMPYCMGSLIWQHNDCWPAASWSTTDYYHNWKAAHYAMREACKPVIMAPVLNDKELELWVINDKQSNLNIVYSIDIIDFNGNTIGSEKGKSAVNKNSSVKIVSFNNDNLLKGKNKNEVVAVMTIHSGKELLDYQHLYFTEHKNLKLHNDPKIDIEVKYYNGKKSLILSSDRYLCNLFLYTENGTLFLKDNYIDILPGKKYEIEIISSPENLQSGSIKTKFIK